MTSYAELIDIARKLDVEKALKASIYKPTGGLKDNGQLADVNETVLAGLHKLRAIVTAIFTPAEVRTSREWLATNGWKVPHGE